LAIVIEDAVRFAVGFDGVVEFEGGPGLAGLSWGLRYFFREGEG